jgi:hypothetical protein
LLVMLLLNVTRIKMKNSKFCNVDKVHELPRCIKLPPPPPPGFTGDTTG